MFKHRKKDLLKISLSGFIMNLMNPGMIILWFTISTSLIHFSTRNKIIIYTTALVIVLLAGSLQGISGRKDPEQTHSA